MGIRGGTGLDSSRRGTLVAVLVCALVGALGCGYRSQIAPPARAEGDGSEGRALRVAVQALRNDSREPWLDRVVTDALRRELSARGRFELVPDPADAEYVLRGRVLPTDQRGSSFSALVVAAEYRLTLALDLEVLRRSGHVVRLAPVALNETDHFLASPDIEVTRTNRLEAYRRLSEMIASRVADSLDHVSEPLDQAQPLDPAQPLAEAQP